MVTIQEVRNVLNNIDKELIWDATIFDHIAKSEQFLEYLRDTSAPTQLVELAICYRAAYLSYRGYLVQLERGISQPPTPGMQFILKSLKEDYDLLIKKFVEEYAVSPTPIVVTGTGAGSSGTGNTLTQSLHDEVEETDATDFY